ncbi:MAG: 4a-hydroxytetrahydrobiopterin dehydratase [Acidimicrobiales bacterium]
MAVLKHHEVDEVLSDLSGWERDGDQIVREWTFPTFRDAISFVVRVSYEAEQVNHHPDIDIRYNRVRLALSTHSEGGITGNDIDLARTLDGVSP